MFCLITAQREEKSGFLKRICRKFHPPSPDLHEQTLCGINYLHILLRGNEKHLYPVDWSWLFAQIGQRRPVFVLGEGIVLPEEFVRYVYDPSGFRHQLLFNAFVQVIEQSRLPLYRRAVSLYDPRGRYAHCAERMVRHAAFVRVVTDFPERYRKIEQYLMDNYGACLTITDERAAMEESVAVFSPDVQAKAVLPGDLPVFCPEGAKITGLIVNRCRPPERLFATEIPKEVDPVTMLGVLWERCGVKMLGDAIPQTMWCGGVPMPLTAVASLAAERNVRRQRLHL